MYLLIFLLSYSFNSYSQYPSHWWKTVSENERQGSWEILPHECNNNELILSKRNELGVFSNLAHTPFVFDGKLYASVEALWQMMKYPDISDSNDIRNEITEYFYTREEVRKLHGFTSKRAGKLANKINKKHEIDFISYNKLKFDYKDLKAGSKLHYEIIKASIVAKIEQNPKLKKLLEKTKGLKLLPDHEQGPNLPSSYYYHEILMQIRDN